MANSYNDYVGNGVTTTFNLTFPYIAQADVAALVGGVATTFTWPTGSSIQFATAPGNGATVHIYRTTNINAADVTWVDGSTIRAADMNLEYNQLLYSLQDISDQSVAAINAALGKTNQLPVVTTSDNGDYLTVVAGVWTKTNVGAFGTAAFVNTGTGPTNVPLNSQLGTASLVNTGAAAGNVPLNSNLGAAAYLGLGNGIQNSGGVSVKNADTTITVAAGGISVAPATNGGLAVASGLFTRGSQVVSADPGSPADGDRWYNSTNFNFKRTEGAVSGWEPLTLFKGTGSAAVANTTTLTACNLSASIPANWYGVGRTFRIRFGGNYVSAGASPTLTIDMFLNGVTTGLDGAAVPLGTSASGQFSGEYILTILSTGSGGTFSSTGYVACLTSTGTSVTAFSKSSGTINTTIAEAFNLAFQWSTASASNSVVCTNFVVEALN